ncbi:hypothetical protein ABPG72_009917 [Tetrahymena utriculariae]
MEIKVINEDKNLVLRLPVNNQNTNGSQNQRIPPLILTQKIINKELQDSIKKVEQSNKQDVEKDYQYDQGIQSARSVIISNRDMRDSLKRDSLNDSQLSMSYVKYNQKENSSALYQSQAHRFSFNRYQNTADHSRMTKYLKSQALEKSCASSQSHETNAIFSLDHVLPSSNMETNRFMATDFVEINSINKDNILKDLKDLKQIREKYEDQLFFADEHALLTNPKSSQYIQWKDDFHWKRIKDLYPRFKFQLLSPLSCQTLIKPGVVQIPYLVTVLNILKEFPNKIMNILENQTLNDTCLYYVRLCLDGVWKYISVDDQLPCVRKSKATKTEPSFLDLRPISLQSHDVWPHLLMKAYAKYLGAYELLMQGNVEETLRDFTGAPIEKIEANDDKLQQIVSQALDRKFIVLAQPHYALDYELQEASGIKANNSYPITNVLLLQGKCIFEIKDFQGNCQWSDPNLFENFKEDDLRALQIGIKQNVFYMKKSDFQRVFENISICKSNDQFYYNSTPIRHVKNRYSAKKFTLRQKGLCYFELNQKDQRLFRESDYNYIQGRVIILKKYDRENFEFVEGMWGLSRNISIELTLDEGEYYVVCILDYEKNIIDTVLSYYGEQPINWQKVNFNKEPNILEKAMKQMCYEKGTKKELTQNIHLYQILEERVGLIAYFYENISSYDSQNMLVDLDLDEEQVVPLTILSSNELQLQPLSNQIFIWKIKNQEKK